MRTARTARVGDWISTASGLPFWPMDPQPEDVRIEDIAHALAHLCRFAGHTREFYSVAQHSLIVSELCGADAVVSLWGLLHDGSEAYLNDITRPVKHSSALSGYRVLEAKVQHAICRRFNLEPAEPATVRHLDGLVLRAEQRDLMRMPSGWRMSGDAHSGRIVPMPAGLAKWCFLQRFNALALELGVPR